MKKRKRIGESGEPWGIPVSVWNQSLSYPANRMRVRRAVRKLAIIFRSHSGHPLTWRMWSSRSCDTLWKAPLISRPGHYIVFIYNSRFRRVCLSRHLPQFSKLYPLYFAYLQSPPQAKGFLPA